MKDLSPAGPAGRLFSLKVKLGIINYGVLGFFLFFSEFLNAIFNNTLDAKGFPLSQRFAFTFKPAVVALYFLFATILYLIVLKFLRPLFSYLKDREKYQQARTSAIRIPWTVLLFQVATWALGTTVYYAMYGFVAESGIPYVFGLLLKVAVGTMAGMYSAILINIVLMPAKKELVIQEVRSGEYDGFSRVRDTLVVIVSSFYIVVTFSYITYYFANRGSGDGPGMGFYAPLFALCFVSMLISAGLVALSRFEYRQQIRSIRDVVRDLSQRSSDLDHRINIMNFNELGEIAGFVNAILGNFSTLLEELQGTSEKIGSSTARVASTSQQNAAYSNEQAAAATEVVSTMEDVNTLSRQVGQELRQVVDQSVSVKEHVREGFTTIQQNLQKMDKVKLSYDQTIEGIRTLGEHITGIWEIVKIINNIAGQIKIIAFNAALEASSAGEAGKNFEIVASEIRRLADNTVASTGEIKARISEIEEASDTLVHSSEDDAEKIQEAWEMSQKIEGLFTRILEASETSAGSTEEIRESVGKQMNAFEQILITMRQISEGISEFAQTIDENSETARTLDETARVLEGIVESYRIEKEESAE
jgi:methyl-accepting chemotaxis protein